VRGLAAKYINNGTNRWMNRSFNWTAGPTIHELAAALV